MSFFPNSLILLLSCLIFRLISYVRGPAPIQWSLVQIYYLLWACRYLDIYALALHWLEQGHIEPCPEWNEKTVKTLYVQKLVRILFYLSWCCIIIYHQSFCWAAKFSMPVTSLNIWEYLWHLLRNICWMKGCDVDCSQIPAANFFIEADSAI